MRRALPRLLARVLLVVTFGSLATGRALAQESLAFPLVTAGLTALPPAAARDTAFSAASIARPSQGLAPVATPTGRGTFDAHRPGLLPALYASTIVLQVLDAHSTMTALDRGAHEANPLMQGVARNRGALLAVKTGAAAGTIYLAEKMWKRNRAGALALMAVTNAIDGFVVAHNYRVASRLR
jgi:hypothetical protein